MSSASGDTASSQDPDEESSEETDNSDSSSSDSSSSRSSTGAETGTSVPLSERSAEPAAIINADQELPVEPTTNPAVAEVPQEQSILPTVEHGHSITSVPSLTKIRRQVGFADQRKVISGELLDELIAIYQILGISQNGTLPRAYAQLILRAYELQPRDPAVKIFLDSASNTVATAALQEFLAQAESRIPLPRPDAVEYVNLFRLLPQSFRPSPLFVLQCADWGCTLGGCVQPRVVTTGLHFSQHGVDVLDGMSIQICAPELKIRFTEAVGLPRIPSGIVVVRRQVRCCLAVETRDGLVPFSGSNIYAFGGIEANAAGDDWRSPEKNFANPFTVRGASLETSQDLWLYIELNIVAQRNPLRVSASSQHKTHSVARPRVVCCAWTKLPLAPLFNGDPKHKTTRRLPLFGGTPMDQDNIGAPAPVGGLRKLGQWIAGQAREAFLTLVVKKSVKGSVCCRVPANFICGTGLCGFIEYYREAVAHLVTADTIVGSTLHLFPTLLNDLDLVQRVLLRLWNTTEFGLAPKLQKEPGLKVVHFVKLLEIIWPLLMSVVRHVDGSQCTVLTLNLQEEADDVLLAKRQLIIDVFLKNHTPAPLPSATEQITFSPFDTTELLPNPNQFP